MQILVYDAAAHQKHQQSTSSENKAKIYAIMLLHTEHNASLFLPPKKWNFLMQMLLHKKNLCESLSSEEKAWILKNDAAAHTKQRESLSPKEKVQVFKTNAATHKKQPMSLSPEEKPQILKKDADAHKKQQEFLSLLTKQFKL